MVQGLSSIWRAGGEPLKTLIAAAAVVAVTMPATAQRTGAPLDTKAESRLALANYADCIIARKGDDARAMLARPYDDRVSKESRILNDDACPFATPVTTFNQNLVRKLDGLLLRGVLYQALIRKEPQRVGSTIAVPTQAAFPIGRTWPGSPADAYSGYIERGRCLMTRDAEMSRRLALSQINSLDEKQALAALAKPLGQCGWRGDEGLVARGALAEIYYRAAESARVQ